MKKPWSKAEENDLIAHYAESLSSVDIARLMNRSCASIESKVKELRSVGRIIGRIEKNHPSPIAEPSFTECFRISGDAISVSDTHLPYWNKKLFSYLFAIAKKYLPKGKRQLIINGDFMNLDAFSHWVTGNRGLENTERELNAATKLLEMCLEVFDFIYITVGNHEERMLRQLEGNVPAERFLKLITTAKIEKRVKMSSYPYSILNDTWRITHPKQYSGAGGTIPVRLCDKWEMSVVAGHNHQFGIQTSSSGKYIGIDQGMSGDPEKIEYHQKNDTTNRTWQCGFTLYMNNYAYPFNQRFTDWNWWLKKKA